MNAIREVELTVSIGGSRCALALVSTSPPIVVARTGRIEWTNKEIKTSKAFMEMLACESRMLLNAARIPANFIKRVGIAWPGPGMGDCFEATFIPGFSQPQPVPVLFRSALAAKLGPVMKTIPIHVVLDAVARAAGEAELDGALQSPTVRGLLVNVATGIAGGLVSEGRALLTYPGIGENYGQFGRFLFYNTACREWVWRPTADGSVPAHLLEEVRWTRHCAGPALARRIASWNNQHGADSSDQDPAVVAALRHYQGESASRDVGHEMTLLKWATADAAKRPDGILGGFVDQIALEIGGALSALLNVFSSEQIDTIVLAGGVGENFGRSEAVVGSADNFLNNVQRATGQSRALVRRAKLGVDAEFIGLASHSFIAIP